MRKIHLVLSLGVFFYVILSCNTPQKSSTKSPSKIFNQLAYTNSGILFSNDLKEDSVINYFTYPYIYMGGGVAIGDVNNDGLSDIYLTGNMVDNKLYLNKGGLTFEDITAQSQTQGDNRWMTGVTMVDINADGWLDIYISVSGKFTTKKNLLYVNQGKNENDIPIFKEMAEEFGIADMGSSTQSTFFDYDKDGDIDLYVANYPYTSFKTTNYSYQAMMQQKNPEKSDKLYRNNGKGRFEEVTQEAGLLNFGLSLSATVGDFNQDGWEDIYVSNDFATPDYFYFNNGDGTFSEQLQAVTKHTSYFGMGTDAADFNNDGLLDLLQMDMTPEDNRRNKANMASMNPRGFWEMVNFNMHYQYMQNTLQLNNGIRNKLPFFSDIARMANVASTDWSWAGLLADFDNDGWKDIFITNGTRRDINNKDYFNKIDNASYQERKNFNKLDLTLNIPSEKIDNYAFKNNKDLTFELVSKDWGLSYLGFSNGVAYGDLDNDGDLDLVVNNIDDKALLFQNTVSDQQLSHYLKINLKGSPKNPLGLGAKVILKNGKDMQFQHQTLSRGFQSSVDPIIHFGVGDLPTVEELTVIWPDGKQQIIKNIPTNQQLTLAYEEAIESNDSSPHSTKATLFAEVTEQMGLDFQHKENGYDDFKKEILLPHAYSKNGPHVAVGDVNGDQLEDFFVGNAIGTSGKLYLQQRNNTFRAATSQPWEADKEQEDMGAIFFDADADGDLDLYVVSGGNEYQKEDQRYQDRLYLNNANGTFSKSENMLPTMQSSGSRVKATDFDKDGDVDLFIGGRVVPKQYPAPAKSYILRNDYHNGVRKFTDITEEAAPDLLKAGLVTDAIWVDYDQDDRMDLVVVGEWMPLTFLHNTGTQWINKTTDYGLEKTAGWWYSIIAEDFDKDGDLDFVAGNLGLNYKYKATAEESFDVYFNDFDLNGNSDIVLGYYNDGVQYPVRGRQCSAEQIPTIKYKYKDYNTFADASLQDIYTKKDLDSSLHFQVWTFESSYIENQGNELFRVKSLPKEVQVSSINDMISNDFNKDGNLDLLIAGNLYAAEVETTRNDASYGQLLFGDGLGDFSPVSFEESGICLPYDTKDLEAINLSQERGIIVANNNNLLKIIVAKEEAVIK